MKAITKIIFVDDNNEKFFGEGPYQLLKAIEETGSLHAASVSMGMAYSKAMKLLKKAEEVIGAPLTYRTVGGITRGGSQLTQTGMEWIKKYEAYRNACVEANAGLYMEFFSDQR